MTSVETSNYLKMALELEVSVYNQEQMVEKAKKELSSNIYQPQLESPPTPKKRSKYLEPKRPTDKNGAIITEESLAKKENTRKILCYFCWGIVPVFGVIGLAGGVRLFFPLLLVGLLFPVAYYISIRNKTLDDEKELLKKYQDAMLRFQERVKKEEEKTAKEAAEYALLLEEAQKKQQEAKEEYKQRRTLVKSRIGQMEKALRETKKTLTKLYSLDVIFPKYRNLVAICSIYEYFASGRCSELSGANGAYNLFESELRQNIIIGQLDQIIDQLEQIKQNQYMLYSELRETNKMLKEVSLDVNRILDSTKKIKENSYLAAHYSKITAMNTEAIKYINLVN